MLSFSGNRKLSDIKKLVIASGGACDESAFKSGSDWIFFRYKGRKITYNTFNGRFITQIGKRYVTEENTNMEKYKWYVDLLNLLYLPVKVAE